MSNVDLKQYEKFVNAVTSIPSNNFKQLLARIEEVTLQDEPKMNPSLLLTAAIGLAAECGEFAEIPKKIFFQGKPYDDQAHYHMKRELGDIIWYWINACRALELDPNDVINENVKKLESRYPGGKFDVFQSENRQSNDI